MSTSERRRTKKEDTDADLDTVGPTPESQKHKWAKVSLTIALVASYICLACKRSIVGPTTLNLAQMVNTTQKEIPIIFTMRSFGYVLGFTIGGLFWDKIKISIYRHSLIVFVNVMSGLTALIIPFCKTLNQLGVTFIVSGTFLGILDIGLNVYFLQIWHGESPRYYQTLHLSYAVGYLIGPVMARIFFEDIEEGMSKDIQMMDMPVMPRISYAYVILCLMFIVAAIIWFVICILHIFPTKQKKVKPSLLKEQSSKFRYFAIITTSLLLFLDGSIELGYQHILATFTFTNYGVTMVHSADITTMFWGFFVIGSILTIILAGYFHPHILIICNNLIEIAAGIIFLFLIEKTNQYLAVGNCLLGLGASTLFSNTILWYDSYITITVQTMWVFLLCDVLAEMVIPELLTAIMRHDHEPIAIFLTSVPILYLIIFFVQCTIFFPTGEKYPTDFGKPGKRSTRRRIFPIFLYKRIKTQEDIEDAESPSYDKKEDIAPGPLDKKKSSKEKKEVEKPPKLGAASPKAAASPEDASPEAAASPIDASPEAAASPKDAAEEKYPEDEEQQEAEEDDQQDDDKENDEDTEEEKDMNEESKGFEMNEKDKESSERRNSA
ncbi:hypothetical protein JTE90_009677 [Oedothorax gibbosus]|uniref:Uncharacterized protein n=1 Tax=Oedothorax gibbosus TaxID=931172 RepID=A0AAV6V7B7_9ARAC|nr:hypothetical protein JTE90_009677 [Oedothorax gibbosus]